MPTNAVPNSRRFTHADDCTCAACEDFFGADDEPTPSIRQAIAERVHVEFPDSTRYLFGAGQGRGSAAPAPATEAQRRFVARLAAERPTWDTVLQGRVFERCFDLLADPSKFVSKVEASAVIDALQAIVVAPAAAPARTNRYAGACGRCGAQVAAESGTIAKVDGRWVTFHAGDCPVVPAPVAVADVPAGHYAIASTTPGQDLTFVRVDRPTTGDYAGRVFVKYVVGGQPDQRVRRDAVAGILARIEAAGVAEAAARYGQEIGRCCRCNRHLTDETSRALGIGPECRTKVGF